VSVTAVLDDPVDPDEYGSRLVMVGGDDTRKRRPLAENLGLGITIAAVALLLFVGYVFGWSNLQESRNQQKLFAAFARGANTDAFHGRVAPNGSPVAVLQIPSIGLKKIVVEGTTAADLQQGPGVMPAAPYPGTGGEAVIAGRHLTFGGVFGSIDRLRPGDVIETVDYLGTFKYVVTRSFVVGSGQTLPVVKSNLGSLALVTSGGSVPPSGLYVVQAKLEGTPVKGPARTPAPLNSSELSLGGDSGAILPTVAWGLALVAAVVIIVAAYRRTGRTVLVYVVSTPILLPLAIFTFQNASRLLPATM
jgi:LPXTG-site transpeptidase (sortase) family protein